MIKWKRWFHYFHKMQEWNISSLFNKKLSNLETDTWYHIMALGLILFLLQSGRRIFVSSTEGIGKMYLFLSGLRLLQEARYTVSLFRLFYGQYTFSVPKWIWLSRGQKNKILKFVFWIKQLPCSQNKQTFQQLYESWMLTVSFFPMVQE